MSETRPAVILSQISAEKEFEKMIKCFSPLFEIFYKKNIFASSFLEWFVNWSCLYAIFFIKLVWSFFHPRRKASGWLGFFYLMILSQPAKRSAFFPPTKNVKPVRDAVGSYLYSCHPWGARLPRRRLFRLHHRVHMMHYVYRERDSEGAGINLHKPNTGAKIVTQLVGKTEVRGETQTPTPTPATDAKKRTDDSSKVDRAAANRGETGLFGSDRHIFSWTPRNLLRNPIQENFFPPTHQNQFLYLSY